MAGKPGGGAVAKWHLLVSICFLMIGTVGLITGWAVIPDAGPEKSREAVGFEARLFGGLMAALGLYGVVLYRRGGKQ